MALKFPDIDPVALAIGPLEIRWYALSYLAAFLLGWAYVLYLSALDKDIKPEERDLKRMTLDDFLPWAILGVILGGRLGYILFYQSGYYLAHPVEIIKVWQGGMSFHGGALGMIIAMITYSWRQKIPVLRLTDLICCAVPIGLFFGRIANFINGELYGRVTDVPWGVVFPAGGYDARHPSQLYEAVLEGLLLFIVMFFMARMRSIRSRPGILSAVFLIGYALGRITVEFFRQPDEQIGYIAQYFTMGQILCLPMIAGGLYLIYYAIKKGPQSLSAAR